MGISDATFYNWRKKYGGLGASELRPLRRLEEEHGKTQACAVLRISRSVYRSRARDARPLVQRIKEIAATRVHYGYRRVHVPEISIVDRY